MFYEFAIDPDAISQNHIIFLSIINHFGFGTGRLISSFPSSWQSTIYEKLKKLNLTTMQEKRVKHIIKNSCIKSWREYDSTLSWENSAIKAHSSRPFHAILIKTSKDNNNHILGVDTLYYDWAAAPRFMPENGYKIIKTSNFYKETTQLLLSNSNEIKFIDPYLKKDSLKPIEAMLSSIKKVRKIHFFTEEGAEFRDDFLNGLPEVTPSEIEIKLFLLNKYAFKKLNDDRIHDRYIITEKGGINFSYGLDEDRHAKNTVNRMEVSSIREIDNQYDESNVIGTSALTKVISITGKKQMF